MLWEKACGFQAKDKLAAFKGKTYYFDAHTGNAIKNTWEKHRR
ncbi:MAG: hypothetical protein ACLS9T_00285 [Streptococcus salivarius]